MRHSSKSFRNLLIGASVAIAVVGGITAVSMSDTVPEGHVGLQKAAFSGTYADTFLKQGFSINPLTTVMNLKAQQFPVDVSNVRPKDKDGNQFEDMDVTLFVRLKTENPKAVLAYLRDVGDLTKLENGSVVLGLSTIEKEARSAIPKAIRQFSSNALNDERTLVEERLQKELQVALDAKYPDTFEVRDSNTYAFLFNPAVEASIQAASAKQAQQRVMEIELEQAEQKKTLMLKQFSTLKEVASATGIAVDQILLSQQIAAMSETARYQVRSEPGKAAKAEIVSPVGAGR